MWSRSHVSHSVPSGYSGAELERIDVRLMDGRRQTVILKRSRLHDRTAYRTQDCVGRQAAVLQARRLDGMWDVLHSAWVHG